MKANLYIERLAGFPVRLQHLELIGPAMWNKFTVKEAVEE